MIRIQKITEKGKINLSLNIFILLIMFILIKPVYADDIGKLIYEALISENLSPGSSVGIIKFPEEYKRSYDPNPDISWG